MPLVVDGLPEVAENGILDREKQWGPERLLLLLAPAGRVDLKAAQRSAQECSRNQATSEEQKPDQIRMTSVPGSLRW